MECHALLKLYALGGIFTKRITNDYNLDTDNFAWNYFPEEIPIFHVRKDIHTNMEVTRGRLTNLNLNQHLVQDKNSPKYSIEEFNKIAQCSNPGPDLDGNRGSFSMLKMIPFTTKQALETACAYLETGCLPYLKCKEYVQKSKLNNYNPNLHQFIYRIKNNSIYYDWPWGNERNKENAGFISGDLNNNFVLIPAVLSMVTNLGDSIFFLGGEQPRLDWRIPLPLFSFAPHLGSGDLPFPWMESYRDTLRMYQAASQVHNHSDAIYQRHHISWNERIPKAAMRASFGQLSRETIYSQAAIRPELFDVTFNAQSSTKVRAWSFESDEEDRFPDINNMTFDPNRNHPGFIQPLMQFYDPKGAGYNPAQYKYIIVPPGSGVMSTSGRLANLLAHSGAVILLSETGFSYHFTGRLQPWVHYVPLSYSMADAIVKIEWLRAHDEMAQQIARNAMNFGKSYLRLKDYYCYVANSFRMLADMQKGGDALEHSDKAVLIEEF